MLAKLRVPPDDVLVDVYSLEHFRPGQELTPGG